jgi:two-component system chemotaxis response regulator CheY
MSAPTYGELKFLVVDDMATMRKVVSQQLRGLGVTQITEASDGAIAKETLLKAIEMKQPIQFIVSDWNMPNLSGIELLRFCRTDPNYKDIPFLLVTAESEMGQVSEAISAGVDNYVVKPFTPASFLDKLNAVFKKRFSAK